MVASVVRKIWVVSLVIPFVCAASEGSANARKLRREVADARRVEALGLVRGGRALWAVATVEQDGSLLLGPATDGVAWLKADQNASGSWGTTYEFVDTCTAVETLAETDPDCVELSDGAAWLSGQTATNYEYLARQNTGLAGAAGYEAVATGLAEDLLAARNPAEWDSSLPNWPEGGWGVAAGYETDCLTTAFALLALDAAGVDRDFGAANVLVPADSYSLYEWDIPEEATQATIFLTVSGTTFHLRMQEGSPPWSGTGFSLAPGTHRVQYPDWGIGFTPGHNYIIVHNIGGTEGSHTIMLGYETSSGGTIALANPLFYLRQAQNGDGGWGLQRGTDTEFYTTLHVLLALLAYPEYDLSAELAAGITYLQSQQLVDGSFGYDGVTIPYVTALAADVLVQSETYPFSAPTEDAITALLAMQDVDGSWDQEPYDTALGVLSLWDHNQTPTVDAGSDQYVVDAGNDCLEDVTLSGSAGDVDGTIESYVWTDSGVEIATGPSPTVTLGIGTHLIELTVTDDGGKPASDTVTIDIGVTRETIFEENMDSDPGWTTEESWAWGVPQGNDGWHGDTPPDGPDPTAGCTDNNVYGYNLAGGYEDDLPPTYLTTPAIDCSGHTNVSLSFCRWLCVEDSTYDHASLEVSSDGSTWVTLFDHTGGTLTESAWAVQEYDISGVADGQATVYVRWVMGPTDYTWNYGGWNIDDVLVTGVPYDPVAPTIVSSTPADGYIDPRRPEDHGGNPEGIEQISITFDMCVKNSDGMAINGDAFALTSTSGSHWPSIVSIDSSANPTVVVTLSGPIEVEQWSTMTAAVANPSGVTSITDIDIGFLPCDVDQSGNVNIPDATEFVNEFYGSQSVELIDTDRSGNVNISDATEFATLFLNEWSGRSLPLRP